MSTVTSRLKALPTAANWDSRRRMRRHGSISTFRLQRRTRPRSWEQSGTLARKSGIGLLVSLNNSLPSGSDLYLEKNKGKTAVSQNSLWHQSTFRRTKESQSVFSVNRQLSSLKKTIRVCKDTSWREHIIEAKQMWNKKLISVIDCFYAV